jgi:translation initiation factor IF-2
MKTALTSPHSLVIAFNVPIEGLAKDISVQQKISIHTFNIIYRLTEWLADEVKAKTPKRRETIIVGQAKVLKRFSEARKIKTIGCKILEGELRTENEVIITRRGDHVGEGKIITIQAARQSVNVITAGNECGMQVETDADVLEGDTITMQKTIEV